VTHVNHRMKRGGDDAGMHAVNRIRRDERMCYEISVSGYLSCSQFRSMGGGKKREARDQGGAGRTTNRSNADEKLNLRVDVPPPTRYRHQHPHQHGSLPAHLICPGSAANISSSMIQAVPVFELWWWCCAAPHRGARCAPQRLRRGAPRNR
jgi:hypothetical protein